MRGAPAPSGSRLRRIYAEGWIAGARSDLDAADARSVASLNPCSTAAERREWTQGFKAASARRVPGQVAR